jgi:dTDP-L-rhamnose 4-epimerase
VAELLARELNWTGGYQVLGKFRAGDIRHCYADVSRIRNSLGFQPRYQFEDGVQELVAWVASQQGAIVDSGLRAERELEAHGLVR